MTNIISAPSSAPSLDFNNGCVVALHCSLSSGRQWKSLADQFASDRPFIAPNISGYGHDVCPSDTPLTLAEEVSFLSDQLSEAVGPIHLVGHSYGGAIAFKIATDSPLAHRIRSLTLIEPVLPTLLRDTGDAADQRLAEYFAQFASEISNDLWNGSFLEAIDKFTQFWEGSGPRGQIPSNIRLRMIQRSEKLAFDFAAALAEENVAISARALRVPTLLISGGWSPRVTQRTVELLVELIDGAERLHLPDAGHMLPVSHAFAINPRIAKHIMGLDDFVNPLPDARRWMHAQ